MSRTYVSRTASKSKSVIPDARFVYRLRPSRLRAFVEVTSGRRGRASSERRSTAPDDSMFEAGVGPREHQRSAERRDPRTNDPVVAATGTTAIQAASVSALGSGPHSVSIVPGGWPGPTPKSRPAQDRLAASPLTAT